LAYRPREASESRARQCGIKRLKLDQDGAMRDSRKAARLEKQHQGQPKVNEGRAPIAGGDSGE